MGGRQGGFGRGHGWRNRFWATGLPGWQRAGGRKDRMQPPDAAADRRDLQWDTEWLEAEIQRLTMRLEELKS